MPRIVSAALFALAAFGDAPEFAQGLSTGATRQAERCRAAAIRVFQVDAFRFDVRDAASRDEEVFLIRLNAYPLESQSPVVVNCFGQIGGMGVFLEPEPRLPLRPGAIPGVPGGIPQIPTVFVTDEKPH